jgi:uncharacterized protein YjiS (DUF1127 family)
MMNTVTERPVSGLAARVLAIPGGILDALALALEKRQQRRDLVDLCDHLLHDIGVSRAEVLMEADRIKWWRP